MKFDDGWRCQRTTTSTLARRWAVAASSSFPCSGDVHPRRSMSAAGRCTAQQAFRSATSTTSPPISTVTFKLPSLPPALRRRPLPLFIDHIRNPTSFQRASPRYSTTRGCVQRCYYGLSRSRPQRFDLQD